MKKRLFQVLVFTLIFSRNSLLMCGMLAVGDVAVAPLVDNSGEDRIVNIVSRIKHDVVPGKDEPIAYVQVSNIDQDLNIKEIADFIGCDTVMGYTSIVENLQRPVSAIDESGIVELRKNVIQQLVDDPELKKEVEALLKIAADQEKVVIELLSNSFRSETCPELQELELLKKKNPTSYAFQNENLTNQGWHELCFVGNGLLLSYNSLMAAFLGYAACNREMFPMIKDSSEYLIFLSGVCCVHAGMTTYDIYKKCYRAATKRAKIHALNRLVNVAESIESLSNNYKFTTQFKVSLIVDEQGVAIVNSLKADRYKYEVDYCFNVPAVHAFLYKLYEDDSQLAQIFASIAEMDAYNAIATKILEGKNSERKFCFAQVIDSWKPQIFSTNYWNVLVSNAVINTLYFDKHVILTGPNAGGKTTSIRANLQNIVLAQTYGVAAAEEFEYTPFDVILSYLNISDDLMNGLSLFASEIKRAKDLLEIIKALQPNQKLFFALDELFTGTAAEQGEKCAYEFIKKTAQYDQTLFIYATHFDKLKELGKQNVGLMNYKVDAPIKNEAGKLVYPFTLSAGASNVNIAMDMAKEANLFD